MFDLHLNEKRRSFLRVGGLSALGLSLPTFLRSQAHAAEQRSRRAKSVILVYLGGGLSHHDSFDPKPDASEKYAGSITQSPQCHWFSCRPAAAHDGSDDG